MTSMVAKASSGSTSQPLPTLSVKEKGSSNKRKYGTDPPNDASTFHFSTEKVEISPKHEHPCDCNMCCNDDHSDNLKLNLGLPAQSHANNESPDADWSDLTESQLEELVLSNLDTILKGAIKEVVDSGYSKDVAKDAVLRSGLCHVFKISALNIKENALNFLKNGQGSSRDMCFEDLAQMAKYILAELVFVLREVRPVLSSGDAMWCLLISDLNLSQACAVDIDIGNSVIPNGEISENSSNKAPEAEPLNPCKPNPMSRCAPTCKSKTSENSVILEREISENSANAVQTPEAEAEAESPNPMTRCAPTCKCGRATIFRGPNSLKSYLDTREEKSGSSKKVSGITKKEYILRQKSIHFERSFRTYSCKGSSRTTKISGFGGLMVEKKPKSSVDSSCVKVKNVALKIRQTMGLDVCDKRTHNLLTKVGAVSPFDLNLKAPKIDIPLIPKASDADTELSLSLSTNAEASNPNSNLNPSGGSIVAYEKKDEMILKLVPRVRDLENQLQEWTEWANQKIMQVARRLAKDKAELKMLKQEREEVERQKREKQTFEESTMKKLSEMENALYRASGQVEGTNASLRRLEGENKRLRQGMEAAKLRAAESAASCHEVSKREKKIMMQFQCWEKEKSLLQEELVAEKQKLGELQKQVDRAMDLRNKLEAKFKLEESTKEELFKQVASLKIQRHQIEALARSKEELANSKTQNNLEKYKNAIENLRTEISQLKLKSESSKIDALRKGVDGKRLTTPVEMKGNGRVKRERECVMCLSEEISVVFLPCAHQVVCENCNGTHEKQGMDCPSCRAPIQRRICIRYRP